MTMKVDPKAEWAQEYKDAWRILRDWFYDPNMHGVDWRAMRDKYGALVPYVAQPRGPRLPPRRDGRAS